MGQQNESPVLKYSLVCIVCCVVHQQLCCTLSWIYNSWLILLICGPRMYQLYSLKMTF